MSNGIVTRQRSFAGPIVLILIGVAFLLRNLHLVNWEFWEWFGKYWPALLILWGVIKLVEYQQAKSVGAPAPGIGAGGVILIIILASFGFSAHKFHELRDSGMFHMDDEDWPPFLRGETFTFDDQLEQALTPGSTLKITNDRGAINLNVGDGDKIKVMVRKTVHADNQDEADKYNQQTKPQLKAVERTTTLDANTGGAGDHGVNTDLEVYIPRKGAVVITSKHGDVSVMGRDGDIEVNSQNGEVSLQDLNGNAKLDMEKSTVRVSKLVGDIAIDGRVNEVNLSDVKGSVRLSGEFHENVSLARIAKSVSFKTSRTDLELSSVAGSLEIDGGDLHGTTVAGPVRLLTKEKDIRLNGVSGDVRISNNDGAVELHINKLPVGNLDINNRNADVQIYLPDHAGFKLEASTDNGNIESGFSELKVDNQDDRGRASGIVGNGAGSVRVSNAHGGIEIRRGSEEIATPDGPEPPDMPPPPKGGVKGHPPKEGVREF
jgi:putative adhesin/cell wall-active antibiotic response 4TMS protein YvqF